MKRLFRYVCVFLAAFTLLSLVTVAGAAGTQVIDASHTSAGYVTVSYTSAARLKVGIQYGSGKTAYRDCPSGTTSFALDQGNGTYTVSVCQNLSGTSYRVVASQTMRVTIDSANAPYLISTSEVPFTAGDAVTTKAAELCKNAKTDEQKVVAIYNFIAGRYTYDQALADRITSGQVKSYIPSPTATLSGTKGICYDFASLFAAMCRSQNIPCALTKGYAGNSYHAWNKVNVGGKWYAIDLLAVFGNIATMGAGTLPMQSFYLYRRGLDAGGALGIMASEYVLHKISVLLYATLALLLGGTWLRESASGIARYIRIGYGIGALIVLFLTLLYTWDKVIGFVGRLLRKFPQTPKWDARRTQWLAGLTQLNTEARKVLLVPPVQLMGVAVSMMKLFVLYSIPYLALRLAG